MNTRYYLYISDAKVEMLLPQVPSGYKERMAAELGFNLGLVSGKLKSETNTLESRVARLNVVERHIRENESIGSIERPQRWVEGTCEMWTRMEMHNPQIVFFLANVTNTAFALGGSSRHLIGDIDTGPLAVTYSFTHRMLNSLAAGLENPILLEPPEEWLREREDWANIVDLAVRKAAGPKQKLSFLAKLLLDGRAQRDTSMSRRALLATPLYVALEQ